MKASAQLLRHFIQDFNLENTDHTVCFTANIEFRATHLFKKMNTEIHLVTVTTTGLSVLYLLDPDISKEKIPDYIRYDDENFSYEENQFLSIKGISPEYGSYTLKIYPTKKNVTMPMG